MSICVCDKYACNTGKMSFEAVCSFCILPPIFCVSIPKWCLSNWTYISSLVIVHDAVQQLQAHSHKVQPGNKVGACTQRCNCGTATIFEDPCNLNKLVPVGGCQSNNVLPLSRQHRCMGDSQHPGFIISSYPDGLSDDYSMAQLCRLGFSWRC